MVSEESLDRFLGSFCTSSCFHARHFIVFEQGINTSVPTIFDGILESDEVDPEHVAESSLFISAYKTSAFKILSQCM